MTRRVLVANRGEIAVRIIRACQDLGIETVAIYADIDRDALHAQLADQAYALGGNSPADSYLNIDKILSILEKSGANAIHPGYGFLAENADFAERVMALPDVNWIGPCPDAIRLMGDKVSARNFAEAEGIRCIPGSRGPVGDVDEIRGFIKSSGLPIVIKAAHGGGGKGLRIVERDDQVEEAFQAAKREAKAYFGREECLVERCLDKPRHVEVQVIADTHGSSACLYERDCSVQRRNQKIIEEAPAPNLPQALLDGLRDAALRLTSACNYVNAGTVEFLVSEGEYYFLEMNTRLQVEHPVTELVTGIDIVAEQIRIGYGEPLSFDPAHVALRGHAIECRINAETIQNGKSVPSTGRISRLRVPNGPGVRWDGGYEAGDEIPQFFDNLIGKLIVSGETRELARRRMLRALEEMDIGGVHTNLPTLKFVLAHGDFERCTHCTSWFEQSVDVTALSSEAIESATGPSSAEQDKVELTVEIDGQRKNVSVWLPHALSAGLRQVRSAPQSTGVPSEASQWSASVKTSLGAAGSSDPSLVVAPMQGVVVDILVEPGDTVSDGQAICIVEAMKMENELVAQKDGTVVEILAEVGQSVNAGDLIARLD